jgi:hypothetical protein
VGTEAVRKAFAAAWAAVPDAQWVNGQHFVHGDFGTSQWTFTGTAADGSRIETDGIDVFTFKGRKDPPEERVPQGPPEPARREVEQARQAFRPLFLSWSPS